MQTQRANQTSLLFLILKKRTPRYYHEEFSLYNLRDIPKKELQISVNRKCTATWAITKLSWIRSLILRMFISDEANAC